MIQHARHLAVPALLLAAAAPLGAQQFKRVPGAVPGTPRWSEGCEAADVDLDGDLDVFVADGDGFASPGTKRQNVLLVNQLEVAAFTFADESVARLGVRASNAKMVVTGDVDADGWIDAFYCNAFMTDPNFLYVNQGAAAPGFFMEEGAARGFGALADSGSAMFGDVDDDGDLDLLVAWDYLDFGSEPPRLFLNDGNGFFAQDLAFQAAAPSKNAQMDVHLVDLDGDWDLDFFGPNRSNNPGGNHYLMLNDGTGAFTDASSIVPNGSSNVYEAEVGDLDGDSDIDLFFVSLSGFSEGPVLSRFAQTGVLAFAAGTPVGGDDDNEVALFDYDLDGDLDVFVGSLGPREKMLRNDGGGVFVQDNTVIEAFNDRTLDCTVADFDNDGAYDLFTVQGESFSATWENKVYRNDGPPDTLPPVVAREEALDAPQAMGPWKVRAEVRDQVMDDGVDWVRGEARYVVNTAPETASVSISGLAFQPPVLNVAPGTTVTWTNNDAVEHDVESLTDGYGFTSGPIPPGGTWSYTFVTPGTYDYECALHPLMAPAQVVVSGSASTGKWLAAGVGLHRFEMTDTAACQGVELAYELRFTDWAGNLSVTESVLVSLAPPWTMYGVGASPANTIDLDGAGSTGIGQVFQLVSTSVPSGILVTAAALGEADLPFLGGALLVDPLSLQLAAPTPVAGGSGTLSVTLPASPVIVGLDTFWQSFSPDAGQPAGWALSNGLRATICP